MAVHNTLSNDYHYVITFQYVIYIDIGRFGNLEFANLTYDWLAAWLPASQSEAMLGKSH